MRSAGVLLPVTSLPSPCGVGTLGQAARDFIDFLQRAGQSYWQILPIGPTGFGDSPYQSFSSYAGNPYLIDLDELAAQGLLKEDEFRFIDWGGDPARVDYGLLYERRFEVLRRAVERLAGGLESEFAAFCELQASWLDDYSLFMAIKDSCGGLPWQQWPEALRRREPAALEQTRRELGGDIRFWRGAQFLFFRQWAALHAYANERGIKIIGDLPIYVAADSADAWADPEQFLLDGELRPTAVAGCPPDGFTADGQLWGNPLFNWEKMKEEGYSWWLRRIAYQFGIYDVLRIDHFRGFDEYYAIPYGDDTARNGEWRPGPGLDFFLTLEQKLGRLDIIAEDLGFLTPSVYKLLEQTGFPGMKVLQFAFDTRDTGSGYLPHCYGRHCVVYTGTHDNDTIEGWMKNAPAEFVARAADYLRLTPEEGYNWGMIRGAMSSVGDLAVILIQDMLGLGSEARINTPSTLGGNWLWRCGSGVLSDELARRLYHETELYGRLP